VERGWMPASRVRLGRRTEATETGEEPRFFEEPDRQALERLKRRRVMGVDESTKEHCPRCGATLTPAQIRGVEVLQCPVDCGTWLDKGALEVVAQREHDSWLGRLFYGPKLDD